MTDILGGGGPEPDKFQGRLPIIELAQPKTLPSETSCKTSP